MYEQTGRYYAFFGPHATITPTAQRHLLRVEITLVPDHRSCKPTGFLLRNVNNSKGTNRSSVRVNACRKSGGPPDSETTRVRVRSLPSVRPNSASLRR